MHLYFILFLVFLGVPALCAPHWERQDWIGGIHVFSNDRLISPKFRGSTPAAVALDQDTQVEVEAVEVAHENISIELARIVLFYSFIILVAYCIWSRVMDQVLDVIVKYQPRYGEKRIEFVSDELIL
ncbi:Protein CBG14661 [Caenorhabditis briggsae]|uniref:Uncharacterized protein n=2 Tax=Caenorhabditis briggsae TaxID=6238 RepID=A0AAE9JT86_CAEBR|nr:Protein CBG14661 [Caenorhabditis briggsae]ULT82396.1 hypothetical protein L3Y34_011982 [Caenorhabditis briggsae]UMM41693.1 hypothetical protein L5515_017843 [Caenorhabditis briggsae]CAP33116.1 Protein CBG14661 [Caenorhabditis briggsae]